MSDTTVRPITPAVGFAREAHRRAQTEGLPCGAGCLVCLRAREIADARPPSPTYSGASTITPWSRGYRA